MLFSFFETSNGEAALSTDVRRQRRRLACRTIERGYDGQTSAA
jgi:hypothetical protein